VRTSSAPLAKILQHPASHATAYRLERNAVLHWPPAACPTEHRSRNYCRIGDIRRRVFRRQDAAATYNPTLISRTVLSRWNPVDVAKFLEFPLQAMSQGTFRSQLAQESFGLVECIRVDVSVPSKNLVDTTLHFGFRKHWSTPAEKTPNNSLDTPLRPSPDSIGANKVCNPRHW
jgi:hypothetical protein